MLVMFFILGILLGLIYLLLKFTVKEVVMSDTHAQAATTKRAAVPKRNNMIHDVLIVNSQLLHDKMLGILAFILGEFGTHGVTSMVYTEEYPKTENKENVLARYHADAMAMVINLLGHFEMTVDILKKGSKLTPWAYLWNNIIRTPLHELQHAEVYRAAGLIYSVSEDKEFDEEAELYSKMMIIELAKKIDIEPPPMAEDPYFGISMVELHEEILASNEPWAVDQKIMIAEGLVYYDSKTGVKCKTLREYFMLVDGTEGEEWQKPVTTMTGMVKDQKPVAENPIMETVTPIRVSPVAENSVADLPAAEEVSLSEEIILHNLTEDDNGGVLFNPHEDDDIVEELFISTDSAVSAEPVQTAPAANVDFVKPLVTEAAPVAPPMKQLTPHNMTAEQMRACLKIVLLRLYLHIFNKCGFKPGADHGFQNAAAVLEPVYIGDVPGASELFVFMDTMVNGQKALDVPIDGYIKGRLLMNGQLPGYHLYLNINGMKAKRSFLAQNPNKVDGQNQPTKWAQLARQGNMIGMMSQEGKGVRVKISCPPTGGQPNYEFDPFKKDK